MEIKNNFIDRCMAIFYGSSLSLMDVLVCGIIIPILASTYSAWYVLLILAWCPYSAYQGRKYGKVHP